MTQKMTGLPAGCFRLAPFITLKSVSQEAKTVTAVAEGSARTALPNYITAIRRLLDVTEEQAARLAQRMVKGETVFSSTPLDVHPAGISATAIQGFRKNLVDGKKVAESQYRLDEALRVNAWRRRAFEQWLRMASLPHGWLDHMLDVLRPEVTYVHFMVEVDALLVETD